MQYVMLNDGNKMPQLGFGVFQVPDLAVCEQLSLIHISEPTRPY